MLYYVCPNKTELGIEAAKKGTELITQALEKNGTANIVLATGASQFEMLKQLVEYKVVDWSRVTVFQLEEYIGLNKDHPALFRKYLHDRFETKVARLKAFHYFIGDAKDPRAECLRMNKLLGGVEVHVAFLGFGENSHLAFNDPPADFEIKDPYIIVNLDENCRKQQMGEGWFKTVADVPTSAISMSISQIMRCKAIIASVPDERKAKAVHCAIEGPVSPDCPSSILQMHNSCFVYLDPPSASLLQGKSKYRG